MSSPSGPHSSHRPDAASSESEIEQIRQALAGLQFGSVNIIVQDGVIVQIDRTEKKRLQRRGLTNGACS